MNLLWQDIRYASRMLLKSPVFSLVAIISIALGIGANTAIFSLVNTALLRPLPIDKPDELVALNNAENNRLFPTFSYPNYRDFRNRNAVFSDLIAYRFTPLSVSRDGVNERLWGYLVSGNYFETLGIKPTLGRVITPDDDRNRGAHPVTVLSYAYWQKRLGGSPNAIGSSITVNGRNYEIVGIAPRGFNGTEVIAAPEMWFPLSMQAQIETGNSWLDERGVENIFVQGRLKPDVSMAQAGAAMNAIAADLEREYPNDNEGKRVGLSSPGIMGGAMQAPVIGFLAILMIVVGLVLLLACLNLANLLLAKAAERRKEIAVRLAMGASRFQLVRQLLTESVLLSLIGGAFGLLIAFWLIDLLAAIKLPIDVPLLIDLHIDYRVLTFAFVASLAAGILFGLLPALQTTKTDFVPALKGDGASSGYRASRLKSGLIVSQVALSLILLIAGGLMIRGLQQAQFLDLGFNPQKAVEISFDLRLQGYDKERGRQFQKQLLEQVRALPNVQAAGIADLVPVDLHFGRASIYIEGQQTGRDVTAPRAFTNRISPGYLAAMGTRLIEGRNFTEQDDAKATPVVIVNQEFARSFFANENPLGKRFRMGSDDAPNLQIIGVTQDGKYANLNEDRKPFVFRPLLQSYTGSTNLIVRADGEPRALLAAIRNELRQLDSQIPISIETTLEERMSFPLLPVRIAASALGGFGLVALALAAIGLYGVISYAVTQRTREIGIRIALGAEGNDVMKLIIGQGMKPALFGVVIGLIISLAAMRMLKSLLYGVNATDPLTFASIIILLSVVALFACYLPARRATKVDPMVALRYE